MKYTFDKLIETMKAPVQWTGIFAVVDDYMILQGQVRSLFFHFDTKKVVTNIIDIPVKEDEVWEIVNNVRVRNTINMILYAFGKWGNISGLRVDKDYRQLNSLFAGIMKEIGIDVEYNQNHFRFFENGIRITYEDVIQAALKEQPLQEAKEEEAEGKGLWHNMIWQKKQTLFPHVETTLAERIKGRLGNNFYLIGYLCPDCGSNLFMVVYPMDCEVRVETEEGGVLLARACVCDSCNCFFTPRPRRLLAEGDAYYLPFGEDRKAYEDYLELMGQSGERVSNSHFNEFADRRGMNRNPKDTLEELSQKIEDLSAEELEELEARLDEVFFSDESTKKFEHKIRKETRRKQKEREERKRKEREKSEREEREKREKREQTPEEEKREAKKTKEERSVTMNLRSSGIKIGAGGVRGLESSGAEEAEREEGAAQSTKAGEGDARAHEQSKTAAASKRYDAKMRVMERLSERQMKELENQIKRDGMLTAEEKESYLGLIKEKQQREKAAQYQCRVDDCEKKPYAFTKRVETEIRQEENLPSEEKEPLLAKLARFLKRQGEQEVKQMMEQMPAGMDREQHKSFMKRLAAYEEVDLAPYQQQIKTSLDHAEEAELKRLMKGVQRKPRADCARLAETLRAGDYEPELVKPYIEELTERIEGLDRAAIDGILDGLPQMGFAEGWQAYQAVMDGEFLPELKTDALKMLEKRLSKIKADESELLVKKLQDECREAGIPENERHHFYPARKVLMGQASKEETKVIDYALETYAGDRNLFEYPILVVDTTRGGCGKEGMILTPEHLYYSTFLSAYGMDIASIRKVTASTGLLNRGLYVHQGGGQKIKIPYAVDNKDLASYAKVLDAFIRYLGEKPDSRNVAYLAKEKHEKLCCYRCGTFYQGGSVCPKCGYKNNA